VSRGVGHALVNKLNDAEFELCKGEAMTPGEDQGVTVRQVQKRCAYWRGGQKPELL